MKYFISKPSSHKLDDNIVVGIKEMDAEANFVTNLDEADICVMQKGWTKSKICVVDYHFAREKNITIRESYLYTDRFNAKTN